jgi:single-stranded-DNA-specific exonuclease
MEYRWTYKPLPPEAEVADLAASIRVTPPVASLLLQRNISTYAQAKSYFRPSLHDLHDPFLMKDMDKAVTRLEEAIGQNETIMVYGDYDVDGTTSVALFYGFLKTLHSNLLFYVPDRYAEGYGISRQGMDYAREQGVKLIVSLDCGIKSADKVAYAKESGIDFIICDHHRPDEYLPGAVAVLDPKRADCEYPYKELSGCGVGFKLLQGFCMKNEMSLDRLYPFMDLLAISIAADLVPITGENRIMAHFGLRQLNFNPRPGLRALIKVAALEGKELEISSIVFGLGPRINAAGRIAHASAAIQMLLAHSEEEALELARQINLNNRDRQEYDVNITREALSMIEGNELLRLAKTTVLLKDDWHKGVIGIVASRCIEKYHRPTIIFTNSQGKLSGSARSVIGFDVYEAIAECSDLLEQFGGHTYAAGLTLKPENFPAFREKFEAVVASRIREEQLIPQVEIDTKLDFRDISGRFYNVLNQMAPFGPQNMRPVFESDQVYAEFPRIIKDQHLKIHVYQQGSQSFEAIGFGLARYFEGVATGKPFRLCYQVAENNYRDQKSLQLLIKDIKFYEE